MPDAMSEASLSLIRSRTVRRPISALRCGTWAKTLIGGARKLIPPNRSTTVLVGGLAQHAGSPVVKRGLARRSKALCYPAHALDVRFRGHDTGRRQVIARARLSAQRRIGDGFWNAGDNQLQHFLFRCVSNRSLADIASPLQHHHPIADLEYVVQAMRDNDLRHVAPLGLERNGPRNRHRLLTAAGKAFDLLIDRVYVDLQTVKDRSRVMMHARAIDEESKPARPPAEKNVLADVEISAQCKVLVDHLDAEIAALVRTLEMHGRAVDQHVA